MFTFAKNIQPYIHAELQQAKQARAKQDYAQEFKHLENAHVLGQQSTYHHTRIHCLMLLWGIRQHKPREIIGQLLRVVGAVTKTAVGLIPEGNTGGSNISPFKPLALSTEHASIIAMANKPKA